MIIQVVECYLAHWYQINIPLNQQGISIMVLMGSPPCNGGSELNTSYRINIFL